MMKALDIKLSYKVLILVTAPMLCMLCVYAVLMTLQKQAEDEIWRERHSKAIIAECQALTRNFMDAGLFLYLYGQNHQQSYLKRYKDLSSQIPVQLASLKEMLREGSHEDASLKELQRVGDDVTALMLSGNQFVESDIAQRNTHFNAQGDFVSASAELLSCLRKLVAEQKEVELANPEKEAHIRRMIGQCLVAGIVVNFLLAVLVTVFFNRSLVSRLNLLIENTQRLAAGKELMAQLQGRDEVAKLDGVFHKMADDLADASQRKQELIQMVTHDLRTPLTSIDASLMILFSGRAGPLTDKMTKQVGVAKRSTERLLNLINDLLDIERLETGNFPIDCREVPAQKMMDMAAESVKALASEKQVAIRVVDTDVVVYADPARIEQILINLVSNAVKFSPEGASVELEVEPNGKEAEFQVIDHGRGVPEEYKTVIFERFGQVKKEDSKRGKGTGLGLPICKALVEAHEGTIGVRSAEGQGSTFWFRIPMIKV
jgi:signal transduction histidine kinase